MLNTQSLTKAFYLNYKGVRYIINKNKEQCINITTLDSDSFDSISANKSNYIRIRTALELFHFDKTDYQYHGSVRFEFKSFWILITNFLILSEKLEILTVMYG